MVSRYEEIEALSEVGEYFDVDEVLMAELSETIAEIRNDDEDFLYDGLEKGYDY